MANPVGRPVKWQRVEELEAKAEEYFAARKLDEKPITVTGLALALDTTRETLCDYQAKDEFSDAVKKLKLRVEQYAEERLYSGPATGPIFALKNFGWKDSQDMNLGGQKDNPVEANLTVTFVKSE